MQAEKIMQKRPKTFSSASYSDAYSLIIQLELTEVNGTLEDAVDLPPSAPQVTVFDFGRYHDEDAGIKAFMKYREAQLISLQGVTFGRGKFAMCNFLTTCSGGS